MKRILRVLVTLILLSEGSIGTLAATPVQTFPVARIVSAGESVVLQPTEEFKRQIPIQLARLYGIAFLPAKDPYRPACSAALTRLTQGRSMVAQLWTESRGKVVKLSVASGGQWLDLGSLLVEEGAALARREGAVAPYAVQATSAERAGAGTYAYRKLAWFWANSTAMYATTLHPTPGVSFPMAVARVDVNRIEAGYLIASNVVLLNTAAYKLGFYLLEVKSEGPALTISTRGFDGRALTIVWRWNGRSYQFHTTSAP